MDTKYTCAQTLLTILSSWINILEGILNDHLTKRKIEIFTLTLNEIFI